jgi:competence protein ComGC
LKWKTGNKLFYLKYAKVGLKPDNVSFLINSKGRKVVYLLKYGFKNFVFISPVVNDVGRVTFRVGEEDINWAVNSYESNKKRFSQSLLFQLLPFLVLAVISVIILIMMIYLFKQFSVFSDVAGSIRETAVALNESARTLALAHNVSLNPSLVSGGVI